MWEIPYSSCYLPERQLRNLISVQSKFYDSRVADGIHSQRRPCWSVFRTPHSRRFYALATAFVLPRSIYWRNSFFFCSRVSWGPRCEETCPTSLIHNPRRSAAYSVHLLENHLPPSRLASLKNMLSRKSLKRKELKEKWVTANYISPVPCKSRCRLRYAPGVSHHR